MNQQVADWGKRRIVALTQRGLVGFTVLVGFSCLTGFQWWLKIP